MYQVWSKWKFSQIINSIYSVSRLGQQCCPVILNMYKSYRDKIRHVGHGRTMIGIFIAVDTFPDK